MAAARVPYQASTPEHSHLADMVDAPAFIATASGQVVFANAIARTMYFRGGRTPPTRLALSSPAWALRVPLRSGRTRYYLLVPEPDQKLSPLCPPWAAHWRLQPRQVKVALCIARGLSDKEIADKIGVTLNTARTYVKQLYACAHVHSRTQLVRAMSDAAASPIDDL